jgi:hypothetical protein
MRIAVIDGLYWPNTVTWGAGAQLVRWWLTQRGCEICDIGSADVVLMRLESPDAYDIAARARKKIAAPLIVGGPCSQAPAAIADHCDAVICGDFRRALSTLLEGGLQAMMDLDCVYAPEQSRRVIPDQSFPWDAPPMRNDDRRAQIVLSRGCRRRCAFCSIGWCYDYMECDRATALGHIEATPHPIQYVTNDLAAISYSDDLPAVQAASSMSVAAVRRSSANAPPKMVRLGIEGPSERMRRAVGKPIGHDILIDTAINLSQSGRNLRFFIIAGLPGSELADYAELLDVVAQWVRYTERGTLWVSATAFVPMAGTPLGRERRNEEYYDHVEEMIQRYLALYWCRRIKFLRPRKPENAAAQDLAQRHPGNCRLVYPHSSHERRAALGRYWRHAGA